MSNVKPSAEKIIQVDEPDERETGCLETIRTE